MVSPWYLTTPNTTYKKMNSLVLIGMMGSGKTSLAKEISRTYALDYYDTDACVEDLASKDIASIFRDEGQAYFRDLETQVLKDTLQEDVLLASGGGIILRKKNRDLLKKRACVIYLKASVETLCQRLSKDRGPRPLLENKDLERQLSTILKTRKSMYENSADYLVCVDNLTEKDVFLRLSEILNKIGYKLRV